MKVLSLFVAMAFAFSFLAMPAFAAGEGEVTKDGTQMQGFYKGSDLLDKSVMSSEGEVLGDLDDIIIGQDGTLKYGIISSGGFLGMGEEQVAVPLKSIQLAPEQDALMVNVTQDRFENAPRFDQEGFTSEMEREVSAYYGAEEMEMEPEAERELAPFEETEREFEGMKEEGRMDHEGRMDQEGLSGEESAY
ncbi:MAG: PRC-barrel domain containing protein [Candidatus Abyssobacteria bacterium SURF_5]|uniref:PRC-barrel domain containing protein n=1 Tax=Abyssobacteria bacterium (strain SURF_5) TaxID=2093360 RepID=A0A3A4NTK7_ABYX5|nr:MAG: PRC-barrel domain containing protein [Candidatus Abyssubacteria bacterium SURF_5]